MEKIMENKELLLQLVKKLESGEIYFEVFTDKSGKEVYCLKINDGINEFDNKSRIKIGWEKTKGEFTSTGAGKHREGQNEEFLDNFYKEKGVKYYPK